MRTRSLTRWTLGRRDQTDAVAKCCRSIYYRHSAKTWLEPHPWRWQMPEHAITCSCGATLEYKEVSA